MTDESPDTKTFTRDEICAALNWACDEIDTHAGLPETGVIDAMNLLVNAALIRLDNAEATLEDAAGAYDVTLTDDAGDDLDTTGMDEKQLAQLALQTILGWIGEA